MELDFIALSEPECGQREIELVNAVLQSSRWSDGPMLDSFERAFAGWVVSGGSVRCSASLS